MKGCVSKYKVSSSSRPRWRYRVFVGKDHSGRKVYEGEGGFAKEGDARAAMQERIEQIKTRTTAPAASPRTLGDWLREWLDTYAVDRCQPKTLERYRQLARYVTTSPDGSPSELAQTPLAKLTHQQLESTLFGLLKAKAKRREHISARTVRHVAGVLSAALNKAFRLELIDVNPMLKVELPSVVKQDARSLTPEEISALREVCRGDWTFALVELALATGARRGELLALVWPDVDWASGTLTINKSLEQTAAGLRIKRPKNGKTRVCRLPQSALAALRFQREQQQEHRRLFAGDYVERNLIFCAPDGDYHRPDLLSQVLVRRMWKAGIKDASAHSLRHTHASNLLSRGVPLPAVSARLGHADPNVTARVYSHALPADDQRAADTWDEIVDGPVQ
jgi:integrase